MDAKLFITTKIKVDLSSHVHVYQHQQLEQMQVLLNLTIPDKFRQILTVYGPLLFFTKIADSLIEYSDLV